MLCLVLLKRDGDRKLDLKALPYLSTVLWKIWQTGINGLYHGLLFSYTSLLLEKNHTDVEKFWFSSTNINFSSFFFPPYTLSYFSNCAKFNGSCYYPFHRTSDAGSQVRN